MKKLTVFGLLFPIALILCFATPGLALYPGFYQVGVLVPYATYGDGVDTSVGLTLQNAPAAETGNKIFWSFIDADGVKITGGSIGLTGGVTEYGFSLAGNAGGSGSGETGYLVFTYDNDGILGNMENSDSIIGNAFILDAIRKDAATIPVISLARWDYKEGSLNLADFPVDGLNTLLYNGTTFDTAFRCRYLIDPTGDPRTRLIVFTPGNAKTSYRASIVSTTGATDDSIEIVPTHTKLNVIDVQSIAPEGFVTASADGSVRIVNDGYSIQLIFALTYSSAVGAEQTLLCGESYRSNSVDPFNR